MMRSGIALGAAGLALLTALGPAAGLPALDSAGGLPSALQSADSSDQPAEVVNDELVLAQLDPTGLPERAVLVSRITVDGAAREVIDPASGTNVRYLDRLGRPEVSPDGVVLMVGGERATALTEARFDKPLPVALHVEYALNGQVIPASEVPGTSGEVAVTYTLTNTTSEPTELTYTDAAGDEQQSTQPVFVPFQGTLAATLPEGAGLVEAPGAMLATDEQGQTVATMERLVVPSCEHTHPVDVPDHASSPGGRPGGRRGPDPRQR